ncbi:L-threonylcarbamoyladenylate synthase [Kyrpidia spormannii]|uniref:Threonylcarbamoyl-AMP synthase n=1 Tax=Kyrpidia spormannii TaxID=2055160 RepID=A0A6F9EI84_9BACL|nr:L-threonylcarbamoyladenylate synthase [Kyrpidia spormannii]CAB3396290.1 tRNA(NNU) t(6)A37 threonylcarbamoyladenosine modification; threonine-dependent ADP-forming ATPase [Kyrpidia spormannii]
METKWMRVAAALDDPEGLKNDPAILEAAAFLSRGETVAFPTETVYGLGADALDPAAVDKIYVAKGRPGDNPLIVHIAEKRQVDDLAKEIFPAAERLMEAFWPGPLTVVLPAANRVPRRTTGGLDTVAIRMPAHPVAAAILRVTGIPVAAPSANRSGRPSPTTAKDVWEDLAGRIPLLVDGGPAGIGVESTVIGWPQGRPVILRPGGISPEELQDVLGEPVELDASWKASVDRPLAPGMKYRHYAPKGQLYLLRGDLDAARAEIVRRATDDHAAGRRVGVLTTAEGRTAYPPFCEVVVCGTRRDLATVAAGLFSALRFFDHRGCEVIYAEPFPPEGIGWAILNRLIKAAGHRVIQVPRAT